MILEGYRSQTLMFEHSARRAKFNLPVAFLWITTFQDFILKLKKLRYLKLLKKTALTTHNIVHFVHTNKVGNNLEHIDVYAVGFWEQLDFMQFFS